MNKKKEEEKQYKHTNKQTKSDEKKMSENLVHMRM
jgi:hypothetical protein